MTDPGGRYKDFADGEIEDSAIIDGRRGVIGKYQLCFQLASGGMARVYLARVQGPGGFEKLVALKRIHTHLADQPEFIEMFLDEARIASRINHPNVCAVFDFGQEDNAYFISMEFLNGETAGRLAGNIAKNEEVRGTRRWGTIAARIAAEACEGLHAAHELKGDDGHSLDVVHRDVSPHNLFVTYDGAVKVVDFGIASARNRLHTTNVGTLKGRYSYMAPEQVKGEAADRRSDVWSVGVTLWEMLTGKRLFKRKNEAETIMAVVYAPIPKPSEVYPDLPRELDDVVMKAIERDADKRYPTARAFGRAINTALVEAGVSVGKPEVSELMDQLFSERREARLMMIEQARTMQAGTVRRGLVDESLSESLEVADSVMEDLEPTQMGRQRRRGSAAVLAAGAVGGILLTLVLVLSFGGGDDPNSAQATVERGPEGESAIEPPAGPGPEAPGPEGTPDPEIGDLAAPADAGPLEVAVEPDAGPPPPQKTKRVRRSFVRGPPGTVSVVTPGGWADIYVRGRRRGRTPARIQLPAGRQVIELRPFGGSQRRRVVVQVPSGGTARASLRVER